MMDDVNSLLDNSVKNILNLCSNTFDVLLKEVNSNTNNSIVAIGLGSKFTNGIQTGIPSLTYLVEKKVPISQLSSDLVIPPIKHGVVTDVVDAGDITSLAYGLSHQNIIDTVSTNQNYNYSNIVQTPEKALKYMNSEKFGTVGCIVKDSKNLYLLSNNHVLNNLDNTSTNKLGTLSRYADINFSSSPSDYLTSNRIDAAIAKICKLSDVNNISSYATLGVNNINGISPVKLGHTVQKLGASTGLTNGKVILLNAAVIVKYNNKRTIFTGQTVTTSMANHGDSGSVGLDKNSSAFGLLFAGSNKVSIYNPIDEVLNKLGINIL